MHRAIRCALAAVGAVLSILALAPIVAADEHDDVVPVVRLVGRGHGHGVGLSQWGAYTMALDGHDAGTIIASFYPGTTLGTASGEVRVVVDQRERVVVRLPQGGEIRSARGGAQAPGFPIPMNPGDMAEIVHDGSGYRVSRVGGVAAQSSDDAVRYRAAQQDCVLLCPDDPDEPEPGDDPPQDPPDDDCLLCTTTTTQPPADDDPEGDDPVPTTPTTPPPSSTTTTTAPPPSAPLATTPVWVVPLEGGTVESIDRGRSYRGTFEVGGPREALVVRNHVDVEQYLMGMAEVPSTWPAAAVQAQTIAARTYALRAVASRGELCDSESCQVYVGVTRETPGQRAAVEATRGLVVRYGAGLAATFYSASGGGHSATVHEGFGASYDVPYLPARPYETDNPKAWAIDVALTDVAARLEYPGEVTDVRVLSVGPSGRPVAMELDGDAGVLAVDPQDFRRRLGLQSTLFEAEVTDLSEAPPPPPPAVDDQLSTEAGVSSQLDVVGDPGRVVVEVAGGDESLAAAPVDAGGAGLPLLAIAALVVACAFTSEELLPISRATVADGRGRRVLGAPALGWPHVTTATMGRWMRRRR